MHSTCADEQVHRTVAISLSSQDRDKEPVIPSFLLGGPQWPNVLTFYMCASSAPAAGERTTAPGAGAAALRDAAAALRLEAVPGALAAPAAGQADMATALRDAAAASRSAAAGGAGVAPPAPPGCAARWRRADPPPPRPPLFYRPVRSSTQVRGALRSTRKIVSRGGVIFGR